MKNFWNSLGLIGKIVVVALAIILLVLIYDFFTGGLSDIKGKIFDKHYTERMQKVEELEKQNEVLRQQKAEFERKAVEAEAKNAIYESKDKALDEKTKEEVDKLDEVLSQLDKEEAETEQTVDAFTRCQRVKQKMLAMTPPVPSAKNIDCSEYK